MEVIVSVSPHIKTKQDTKNIMWTVFLSLIPTLIVSMWLFGPRALIVVLISIITAIITEAMTQKLMKRKITVFDGSAAVTGILFAFTLPPNIPLWMVVIGSFLAIFLAKQLFGGLGHNIFNPALVGRAILLASFPIEMTTWTVPVLSFSSINAITSPSPLNILKMHLNQPLPSYFDLFVGNIPGCLGETCKLTLLIGAIILFIKKIINWRIPISFIGTVAILSLVAGRDVIFAILSGGLILGAFFMATDMVTTPTTKKGEIIFGLGCGAITFLIRTFGGFPEGVCYSILFMNCLTPLIEKWTLPRKFGEKK